MSEISEKIQRLEENVARVVLGKKEVIRKLLVALFAGEHILLEDVPGMGKTLLGRALAKSLSLEFKRIQFTPDLIPADITGGSVFNPKTDDFRFTPGPIFTPILLADEINRTTPRTQSAMLEAMSERQVSCDGVTYELPAPFMVIATENPIEFEGTYPLPESQLDRFLVRISVGYPDRESEMEILRTHQAGEPIDQVQEVLTGADILAIQRAVSQIQVADSVRGYLLDILEATRRSSELLVGVSPRGGIAFCRAAQALALTEGRDYVIPDDLKELAVPVLAHRIILKSYSQGDQREGAEALVRRLLEKIPVPR